MEVPTSRIAACSSGDTSCQPDAAYLGDAFLCSCLVFSTLLSGGADFGRSGLAMSAPTTSFFSSLGLTTLSGDTVGFTNFLDVLSFSCGAAF